MQVNYTQVQQFSFAYTIYNMSHNLMFPLSTRNTIQRGGLSVRESWEGTEAQGGIASLDHYSKGAVCEWLFGDMCGIKVSGENEFTIAPKAGGKFTFAWCEYQSVYGKVSCGNHSFFLRKPFRDVATTLRKSSRGYLCDCFA